VALSVCVGPVSPCNHKRRTFYSGELRGVNHESSAVLHPMKWTIMPSLSMVKKYSKLGTSIFLAGVLLWIYRTYNFSRYTNIDEMRVLIDSFGPYGPVVFIGLCIAGVFLHLIGLTRVRFCQYIAGSALGVVPCIAIACYFADSIARLKSTEPLFTLKVAVPAGLVAALLIISGISARRLFGKKPIPTSQDTQ